MANEAYISEGETWEQPNSRVRGGVVQQEPLVPLSVLWVFHKIKWLQVVSSLHVPATLWSGH